MMVQQWKRWVSTGGAYPLRVALTADGDLLLEAANLHVEEEGGRMCIRADDLFITDGVGEVWKGTLAELAADLRRLASYRDVLSDAARNLEAT